MSSSGAHRGPARVASENRLRVAVAAVALASACYTSSMARFKNASILYQGAPYGDLVTLAERVRQCMHSSKQTLPKVILVDRIFECYTTLGWQQVYGCTGSDEIILVAPVAEQSQGQLWAHELTHYFGDQAENDACGTLALPGFSLAMADAGR